MNTLQVLSDIIHYTTTIHVENFTVSILQRIILRICMLNTLQVLSYIMHKTTTMHVEHFTGSILHYAASYEYM